MFDKVWIYPKTTVTGILFEQIWQVSNHKFICVLSGHMNWVRSAEFNRNARWVGIVHGCDFGVIPFLGHPTYENCCGFLCQV